MVTQMSSLRVHVAWLALFTACNGAPATPPTAQSSAGAPAQPAGAGAAGTLSASATGQTTTQTQSPQMASAAAAGKPAAQMPQTSSANTTAGSMANTSAGSTAGSMTSGMTGGTSGDVTPKMSEPAPTCSGKKLMPGDSSGTLMHATGLRKYNVHAPKQYDGTKSVPLVIDMHGYTSNAGQQRMISGWEAKSDQEGFIVVWPSGLNDSWNGGDLCCGPSQAARIDDQGFILELVKQIKDQACIDTKRVYATGLSNGGAMSHMMGCNAADVFAAVAPISMSNGTNPCKPSRAIPVTLFRATSDTLVGYNGGGALSFKSAKDDFEQWSKLNGCTGEVVKKDACQTTAQCKDGVEVTLCTVQTKSTESLGGHALYSDAVDQKIPVADIVWDVFKRFTMP